MLILSTLTIRKTRMGRQGEGAFTCKSPQVDAGKKIQNAGSQHSSVFWKKSIHHNLAVKPRSFIRKEIEKYLCPQDASTQRESKVPTLEKHQGRSKEMLSCGKEKGMRGSGITSYKKQLFLAIW